MAFREHLEHICSSVEGAVAASIMGFDGIAVDTYERDSNASVDISSMLVEYASILNQVRTAAGVLKSGGVRELIISTDKLATISRPLTGDYFLVLALTPDSNWGKARFVMRVTAPEVQAEF
jgi:predicted regulator of Ras-like GTPase activity (Roadblock/LC7/MglB family)